MTKSTLGTIVQLLRPWWVRVIGGVVATISFYDVCSNQFGWVKIPKLWGMTGSILTWWGWLLILQALFVAALFEYVRRNIGQLPEAGAQANYAYDDTGIKAEIAALETRCAAEEQKFAEVEGIVHAISLARRLKPIPDKIDKMVASIPELLETARQAYNRGPPNSGGSGGAFWSQQCKQLISTFESTAQDFSRILGEPVDLTKSPNFDADPMCPVVGDSSITDHKMRQAYRHLYDQAHTAKKTLEGIRLKVLGQISQSETAVANYRIIQMA